MVREPVEIIKIVAVIIITVRITMYMMKMMTIFTIMMLLLKRQTGSRLTSYSCCNALGHSCYLTPIIIIIIVITNAIIVMCLIIFIKRLHSQERRDDEMWQSLRKIIFTSDLDLIIFTQSKPSHHHHLYHRCGLSHPSVQTIYYLTFPAATNSPLGKTFSKLVFFKTDSVY